jgi:hypothetical protein
MNPVVIILGILIVIVLYLLYIYIYPSNYIIANAADLSKDNPRITDIKNPSSSRYALGLWININSFTNTNVVKIFSRNDNAAITLQVDPASGPNLEFLITSTGTTTKVNKLQITDNFPIQKWVCVIISVDNQFIDTYIDGKLVVSTKIPDKIAPYSNDSNANPIILGNGDGAISRFTLWTKPLNPQEAYDFYMAGNGIGNYISSNYGAKLHIIKDNILSSEIKLF